MTTQPDVAAQAADLPTAEAERDRAQAELLAALATDPAALADAILHQAMAIRGLVDGLLTLAPLLRAAAPALAPDAAPGEAVPSAVPVPVPARAKAGKTFGNRKTPTPPGA